MALSKKSVPPLSSDVEKSVKRGIEDVYRVLNDIINAVNQSDDELRSSATGKAGDSRISKYIDSSGDSKYRLEVRSPDGWGTIKDSSGNILNVEILED